MPIIIEMPALSPTMVKGNLIKWYHREGESISVGDVLAEIETDKASMEIESRSNGILAKILVAAGTRGVLVKTPVAVIRLAEDTDADILMTIENLSKKEEKTAPDSDPPSNKDSQIDEPFPLTPSEDRIFATPLARRIAEINGIDLHEMKGSGPGGRIIKNDVLAKIDGASKTVKSSAPDPGAPFIDEPLPGVMKTIADKLTATKNECPHFYMMISVDVTDLLTLRQKINSARNLKLTVTDFLIKAVGLAIRANMDINVAYVEGSRIRRFSSVDVSVAVASEAGLYTPVIHGADQKGIATISNELKEVVKMVRNGEISASRLAGGSITISNLGMFDIDSFYSIINAPQAGILSIGPATKTPVFDEDDNLKRAMIMKIGYAIDHRVIDGKAAARFLVELQRILSDPVWLVVDSKLGN
ncbi:MAG: 2-oxo acid dehydrogenase subunit E2 [Holosporales bacterium]|jgi:pyruvate dehydrogenase E2 component (dihydrolipoamide acetyltransferase)|nr:2-oxo acid dehydrogenase subunit E2 [Holosporales bacterium]